ncbi:MAG TPA: YqgE/AlgH family protein [Tepidisphaeraceae bacterium]|jgi:putative transcriptional regulator
MQSLQGKLLIASSVLMDPNFVQTIILMVQHDENGALGLVLNRPLNTTVKEACEEALETPCAITSHLFQGGPCEGPLMVLHGEDLSGQMEVISGVHFTTQRDEIEGLLDRPNVQAKFFVGYSGWSAGQLEGEMETGSWLTVPATTDLIFSDDEGRWKQLIKEIVLGQYIDPKRIPDDPSVN